jgi:hypothetical protein
MIRDTLQHSLPSSVGVDDRPQLLSVDVIDREAEPLRFPEVAS